MSAYGLRDYQYDAMKRLKNGNILCGGVGSGKSRTALAYYFKEQDGYFDENKYEPMDDCKVKDLYIITTARKRDIRMGIRNGSLFNYNAQRRKLIFSQCCC